MPGLTTCIPQDGLQTSAKRFSYTVGPPRLHSQYATATIDALAASFTDHRMNAAQNEHFSRRCLSCLGRFPAQWGVFNSWSDLEAPRNAVLVSCPSMRLSDRKLALTFRSMAPARLAQSEICESRLDPDLAPPGHHVVHAYTPATEPWEDWADLDETLRSTKPEG